MKQINQNIERLIVRSLDNDLNEQEQLELNRELIRNPDAREMLEQYSRVDALAVEALDQIVGETSREVCSVIVDSHTQPIKIRHFNRSWFLVPGAIAAAVLAIALPRMTFEQTKPMIDTVATNQPTMATIPQVQSNPLINVGQNQMMQPVSYPRTRRSTGREMLGVMGNDGKIYWIEVDRIRTIRENRPPSPSSWNEM